MPDRPTFAQVLNSPLPAAIGKCAADRASVASAVNEAQQCLLIDPLAPDEGWWGGWVNMVYNLTVSNWSAYLTTPREVARIILYDICNSPRFLRNGFYEYLQFGTGAQPKPCRFNICSTMQGFDRDNVPTLNEFPTSGPQYIRLYPANTADVGARIIVQGTDQNGIEVLDTDPTTGESISGEVVLLTEPFATTVNQFQAITGLMKEVTKAPVQFFTVDPTTSDQTLLSAMEYNETTASYRRYLFNGLPTSCCNTFGGPVQVKAQCKLDFVPVVNDSDYLIIQNIPALIEECQARRYSRMDTQRAAQLEDKHHRKALNLLNGQLDHYLGKVRTSIGVPIFGSDRLTRQPV